MEMMHRLADEVRAVFEDRGYKVGKATELDRAFRRSRRSQSSLSRDLVLDAIEHAASGLGLGFKSVRGGAYDIGHITDGADRRFRVRKAGTNPETGQYEIVAGSENIMFIDDAEPESMYPTERWVFAHTTDDSGIVIDIFAARVLDITDETVPRLVLGEVIPLGESIYNPPTPGTYVPDDEDDLGDFDKEQDDQDEDETGLG
ncbi:hypothetical protein [Nocardioides sp.]|uniref:hypothetical protein n=1 Tax=Nocardioides sp. TaxID=35761 RepID=UPI00321ABD7D